MSIERDPDFYVKEVFAFLPTKKLRQRFKDQPVDERRKTAKEIWDRWLVDGADTQEVLYHWVRHRTCLKDDLVAEPRPIVNTEEELMEPIRPILQLSMEDERIRVERYLRKNPKAASGDEVDLLAELPQLPATVRTARQPYVFGWPITEEWLKFFSGIAGAHTVSNDASDGLTQLSSRAGCSIFCNSAVHPDAPEWTGQHLPPEIPNFDILQICHTLHWGTYVEERPTEAQYQWLTHVLPGKPGWFRCPSTFEDFDELLELPHRPDYIYDPLP
ncbi:hypothetical protein ONZ51_g12743 [Trametes cubensis]|uniref:Uncharacterized protein n=1 Tax=Trametes cubensis TaxID=1111947 RepID=A0AAD7TF83_9APHY|nr:hypothetical protein ONZ51_g12743 [Trametes cubensis]